jgi:hypothetical protein
MGREGNKENGWERKANEKKLVNKERGVIWK